MSNKSIAGHEALRTHSDIGLSNSVPPVSVALSFFLWNASSYQTQFASCLNRHHYRRKLTLSTRLHSTYSLKYTCEFTAISCPAVPSVASHALFAPSLSPCRRLPTPWITLLRTSVESRYRCYCSLLVGFESVFDVDIDLHTDIQQSTSSITNTENPGASADLASLYNRRQSLILHDVRNFLFSAFTSKRLLLWPLRKDSLTCN